MNSLDPDVISSLATLIVALTGAIAAIGALFIGVRNSRKADSAAAHSKAAKAAAESSKADLVIIDGRIRELGVAVDGRLSALLEATRMAADAESKAARAGGYAAGEQAQRDRDTVSPEIGMNGKTKG